MREKRKKVGRPSLGKDAKNVVLQSRVQESEKAAYQRAARAAGLDVSTWIRQTLNQAIKA
jgi:antitoxin component of RelBE/YafQ-DinJ toxin-antitoxin module